MNRSSVSPQAKSKAKQQGKVPSAGLTEFLKANFNGKVPVAAVTAATKFYGKNRPLKREDRTIQRLSSSTSEISASALTEFLNN